MTDAEDARALIQGYIDAFTARDLGRCIELYDEGATLVFPPAKYLGAAEIKSWHEARFAANLSIDKVQSITIDADKVLVDGTISSNRLKKWRVGSVTGQATFQIQNNKIKEVRFRLRTLV